MQSTATGGFPAVGVKDEMPERETVASFASSQRTSFVGRGGIGLGSNSMKYLTVAIVVAMLGCEVPTTGMASHETSTAVSFDELDVAPDWVPAPPFGWGIFKYEFFPDSTATTFDSISTAMDSVTWRYRDYPRFTAYGDGWEVPVWTDGGASYAVRPRVEHYMAKLGRLGAGILSQIPPYGIALLDRVPGLLSLCDPLGATVYDTDTGEPQVVILVYNQFEEESFICGNAIGESATGVMLHEFGHVIADPLIRCTAAWRAAVDAERIFPSEYARYLSWGHDPRIGTADSTDVEYWQCADHPPEGAVAADTIPSGEDVAESFSFWWLTRCKNGHEVVMDSVVAGTFPHRLAVLDSTFASNGGCTFPVVAADRLPFMDTTQRDTVPDGIVIR